MQVEDKHYGKPSYCKRGDEKKHDHGKPMWDLLPLREVEDIVKVLTFGTEKYAPNQWQEVDDAENRYFAAAMRHIAAWRRRERDAKDSKLRHLAHAACNLLFLAWFDNERAAREQALAGISDDKIDAMRYAIGEKTPYYPTDDRK